MKALYDAPTSSSEAEIVRYQLNAIEQKLQEPNLKSTVICDCVVRAMLCHIMGYPVDFAHIYALQLAQKGSITEKKIGYMACAMFLENDSSLILLLINTIIKDLSSTNVMENNIALITAAELVPTEMSSMLVPILIEKTAHSKDFIRKKALVCLEGIATRNEEHAREVIAALTINLSDKDPGVVCCATRSLTSALASLAKKNVPVEEVEIVDPLCSIQSQILAKKFPDDYRYHGIEAPWEQVAVINLLASISKRLEQEKRGEVLSLIRSTMDQDFPKDELIGHSIVCCCIDALAVILPKSDLNENEFKLLEKAILYLAKLLIPSDQPNEVYLGLCSLATLFHHQGRIVNTILPQGAKEVIMNCLDAQDESVSARAFALLDSLADAESVSHVCEKLVDRLRSMGKDGVGEQQKQELVEKTVHLIDTFEADTSLDWQILLLLGLLQVSSDTPIGADVMHNTQTKLCDVSKPDVQKVGKKLKNLLRRPASDDNAPATLLVLFVWCLGQFDDDDEPTNKQVDEIVIIGQKRLSKSDQKVVVAVLDALFMVVKKCFRNNVPTTERLLFNQGEFREFLSSCTNSEHGAIQDHADELESLCDILANSNVTLPTSTRLDCDTISDFNLSYLDEIVVSSLAKGSAPYSPQKANKIQQMATVSPTSRSPSLRLTPYNVLEETEWKKPLGSIMSQSSSGAGSDPGIARSPRAAEVWTLKGRRANENPGGVATPSPLTSPSPKSNLPKEKPIIDLDAIQDLDNWK